MPNDSMSGRLDLSPVHHEAKVHVAQAETYPDSKGYRGHCSCGWRAPWVVSEWMPAQLSAEMHVIKATKQKKPTRDSRA